jgi:hypothetical protein
MNQQNKFLLVQSWANYQRLNTFFFKRGRLSDHHPKHFFVDVCGGA